jgi:hypothetical protein
MLPPRAELIKLFTAEIFYVLAGRADSRLPSLKSRESLLSSPSSSESDNGRTVTALDGRIRTINITRASAFIASITV